ncbi:MAG: GFA family protein [Alphaproteobacteria bacterium]|nr:GFA family protein [Alphaproteobacteria bacterium]
MPLTGGCFCGALRYEIAEAPLATYTCHCTDCQRLTSSAFSIAFTVHDHAFRLTAGDPRLLQKTAGSGRIATRWLCPDCGSWVCSSPSAWPTPTETVRRVRAGTLDDTSWLRPTEHFWIRSKQPWVTLPEGDKVFGTEPN